VPCRKGACPREFTLPPPPRTPGPVSPTPQIPCPRARAPDTHRPRESGRGRRRHVGPDRVCRHPPGRQGHCRRGPHHVADPAAPATAPRRVWLTRPWSARHRRPSRAPASAALAQRAMSSGPALLLPFDGPHRTALKTTWQQTMAATTGFWSDEVACLWAALDSNAAASAQGTFAVHQAQAAYHHLLRGLDSRTSDAQIAQAWLHSLASPCTSMPRGTPSRPQHHPLGLRVPRGTPQTPRTAHPVPRHPQHHLLLLQGPGRHRFGACPHVPHPQCTSRVAP
jgi:hypothetical protein